MDHHSSTLYHQKSFFGELGVHKKFNIANTSHTLTPKKLCQLYQHASPVRSLVLLLEHLIFWIKKLNCNISIRTFVAKK